MIQMNTYLIQLRGKVDLNELNAMSPHLMTVIRVEPDATLFSISTDQSGMIGMLRHLHNLGLILQSIQCQSETSPV